MKNNLFLKALHCQNSQRAPVWLMRQAGRYMPEYQALRSKYSFLEMCHHPELIAEVTQMPLKAFGVDAAILFSDILVIPEALDIGLRFEDKVGPVIERPIRSKEDIAKLPTSSLTEKLSFVAEGIQQLVPHLNVPLIGFCGGPFTVASYMIEGGSSRDLKKTKQWMIRNPESFHQLLTLIADHSIDYLNMQIAAGVDALQIFDSWAYFLDYPRFHEFSLAYLQRILKGLKEKIPVIIFCRGSSVFASDIAQINPAGISVDWQADLRKIRAEVPPTIALQGNLDPDILYASPPVIQKEVKRILHNMKGDPGFIFNLGHGILPDIPYESVRCLVDTVKNYAG